MTALIPKNVELTEVIHWLLRAGLPELFRGKVRHTFGLPGHPDLLLQYASNRISIYDWVLSALVQDKGAVLTAMTVFWLTKILTTVPHHLVAYGSDIDAYLPEELRNNRELQTQALVVKKLQMIPVECIVRGFLTGSGLEAYLRDNGMLCGIQLPPGLHDGSKLPQPIFTPTTKAQVGHDEHLEAEDVIKEYPGIDALSLHVYTLIDEAAMERGFALADTKFEFGRENANGVFVLGDEVGTPDSSRLWNMDEWRTAVARQKAPQPHDKQFVREWGLSVGITNSLKEDNPQDVAFVHSVVVPASVLDDTTRIYREIASQMFDGMELEEFQKTEMGILV